MRISLLFVVVALALTVAPATASAAESDVTLDVEVETDGDAVWLVTNELTLASDSERSAFDALKENQTRLDRLAGTTTARFRNFAERASQQIGRDMTVSRESVEASRNGDMGRVLVTFTWTNFAQTTDDEIVVGDVFSGGFSLEEGQVLRITGPSNPELTAEEGSVEDGSVVWRGPVAVPENSTVTYARNGGIVRGLPGFGFTAAVLALLALLAAAALARP